MILNRFAVKLIYKISYVTKENLPLDNLSWEERIILVKATDFEDAYKKAEKYALAYEKDYENTEGNIVKFTLAYMIDCCKVDDRIKNGVEVYSSGFFDATEEDIEKILDVMYGEKEI